MLEMKNNQLFLVGEKGSIKLEHDEVLVKLAMLYEGECEGLGAKKAAKKHGYSVQRYYQLLKIFSTQGITALINRNRGPKSNSCRTEEVVRQVIRYRFLDPDASVDVIAQKLQQLEVKISKRSVERIIEKYGLQKKTLQVSSGKTINKRGDLQNSEEAAPGTV